MPEELKHNAQVSGLSHWVNGVPFTMMGEGEEHIILGEKRMEPFHNVKVEICVRHSNDMSTGLLDILIWSPKERFRLEI